MICPRLVFIVRQRGGVPLRVIRSHATAPKPIAPKPKKNTGVTSTTAAAVTITLAGGFACYYFYALSSQNAKDDDLQRRHQLYTAHSSSRHRHKLAAYLVSPANRNLITDRVNGLVNVPVLGEHAEGVIIRKAVDQCMDALEKIVVGDHAVLGDTKNAGDGRNYNNNEIITEDDASLLQAELTQAHGDDANKNVSQQAQDDLVQKINAYCNIYGLSEAQEAVLIRGVVHHLFVLYPGLRKVLLAKDDDDDD